MHGIVILFFLFTCCYYIIFFVTLLINKVFFCKYFDVFDWIFFHVIIVNVHNIRKKFVIYVYTVSLNLYYTCKLQFKLNLIDKGFYAELEQYVR